MTWIRWVLKPVETCAFANRLQTNAAGRWVEFRHKQTQSRFNYEDLSTRGFIQEVSHFLVPRLQTFFTWQKRRSRDNSLKYMADGDSWFDNFSFSCNVTCFAMRRGSCAGLVAISVCSDLFWNDPAGGWGMEERSGDGTNPVIAYWGDGWTMTWTCIYLNLKSILMFSEVPRFWSIAN